MSQCNAPCFVSILALTENRFSGPGSGDAGTIYRIVAYVWIVLGLAYVALIINYISNVLVRKAEKMERMSKAKIEVFCLFDLILYVPSTIFQLNRDGSSWVEPVQS